MASRRRSTYSYPFQQPFVKWILWQILEVIKNLHLSYTYLYNQSQIYCLHTSLFTHLNDSEFSPYSYFVEEKTDKNSSLFCLISDVAALCWN